MLSPTTNYHTPPNPTANVQFIKQRPTAPRGPAGLPHSLPDSAHGWCFPTFRPHGPRVVRISLHRAAPHLPPHGFDGPPSTSLAHGHHHRTGRRWRAGGRDTPTPKKSSSPVGNTRVWASVGKNGFLSFLGVEFSYE